MKIVQDLKNTFCDFNDNNLSYLLEDYEMDKTFTHSIYGKPQYIYISKDNTICKCTLEIDKMIELGLDHITIIDGYWYKTKDLK